MGVVEDVRYHGPLGSRRAPHDLYVPFEQVPSHVVSFAVLSTYCVAAAALLMLGLLASYLPARRAAAIDPARVLRGEP